MKVHVYPQDFPHGDVFIVADKEGLDALIAACERAKSSSSSAFLAFTEDGEGFALFVATLEERSPQWEQLPLPYTNKELTGKGGDLCLPDLIGSHRYRKIHLQLQDTDGK